MTGPRSWSLRARLLAGLIGVTAVFLITMGAVSTLVLSELEQNQFSDGIALTARSTPSQIAATGGDYGAAYYNVPTGRIATLDEATPVSLASLALASWLRHLIQSGQFSAFFHASRPPAQFQVSVPGYPDLTCVFREIPDSGSARSRDPLPAGPSYLVVGRPSSAAASQVRGFVGAEAVTGAGLLLLLTLGGRWLIGRALAPLDKMASTADLITSRGDLTARMPDPGDHAEAGRLAAAINTMLDRIQGAFRARWESEQKVRQFAADASHELRTPLTTIRGYAELYRQGALDTGRLPDAMRRIEQEADRMSSLVAELLELARLDRPSSLDLGPVDLAPLAQDAVADARAVEPGRPVSLTAPEELVAEADEARIRQVLANLLSNVRAHTPENAAAEVRLSVSGEGALIEVGDSGPGMNAEAAARAFDRFYRAPGAAGGTPGGSGASGGAGTAESGIGTAAGSAGGTGLGLSIVQAIAIAHGGHAWLESEPGTGTRVRVWIPLHARDA